MDMLHGMHKGRGSGCHEPDIAARLIHPMHLRGRPAWRMICDALVV